MHPYTAYVLASLVAVAAAGRPQAPIRQIVAYGDSLTDTGNIHKMSNFRFPDSRYYYGGRFANGPVWVEWLQQFTNSTLTNWAFAGASTDSNFVQGVTGPWPNQVEAPGFRQQVEQYYLPNLALTQVAPQSETLHALWFGGVDYMRAYELKFNIDDKFIKQAVQNIVAGMQTLHDRAGATRFILLNPPSYRAAPVARMFPSFLTRPMDRRLPRHDAALRDALMIFRRNNPTVQATLLDYRHFEETIQNHPANYNFTNTDSNCLSMLTWRRCPNEENYFYFDTTHPSAAVHQLLGRALMDWVEGRQTLPAII